MVITYFGKQFFKIQQGEMVIAINPISKNSKFSSSARFGSDIAFVTTNHPDYNGVEQVSYSDRKPFIVHGPGDYEVNDILIKGIMSKTNIDGKAYINTIYVFSIDGISIAFLGNLSDIDLSKEANEEIENCDILFIPISGEKSSYSHEIAKLSLSLENKIVIPMDHGNNLKTFLKEMGAESVAPVDKLSIKRKDLDGKKNDVVVLSPQ